MARGGAVADTAANAATSAAGISGNLSGESNSVYGALAPELESQMAHPAGYAPNDLSAMQTTAMQSAGGTQAGATGQGALLAERTGNAGTADAAITQSARTSGEQLSKSALGIQTSNAQLKQKQVEDAQHGLEGIYGTSTGGSIGALGQVASNVNANVDAQNASWNWAKYILDPAMAAAGQGAGMAAGCWIAEAIYGVTDPRTLLLRSWLNGPFRRTFPGNAIMAVYLKIGRQVAWMARRCSPLRAALRPLFEMGLRKAMAGE